MNPENLLDAKGELRRPKTQTYGGLDVAAFLKDLGVRRVGSNPDKEWVSFRCPFHDDRRPSAAMHRTRTMWRCHACRTWGNASRFLSMLKGISTKQAHARIMARDYHNEVPEPEGYVRKTSRVTTGSLEELELQQEHAIELLQKGGRELQSREGRAGSGLRDFN